MTKIAGSIHGPSRAPLPSPCRSRTVTMKGEHQRPGSGVRSTALGASARRQANRRLNTFLAGPLELLPFDDDDPALGGLGFPA
jgi:hypothetical protein